MFGEFVLWALLLAMPATTEVVPNVERIVDDSFWGPPQYKPDSKVGISMPLTDPVERMQKLMYQAENDSQQSEWERFWMVDQPSHLTPDRTHGGVR